LQQLLTGFHFVNHHGGFLGETGTCPSCSIVIVWLDCSCRGSARVYRRSRQAMPDRQRRVGWKATKALTGNRWLSLPYRFLIDFTVAKLWNKFGTRCEENTLGVKIRGCRCEKTRIFFTLSLLLFRFFVFLWYFTFYSCGDLLYTFAVFYFGFLQ
jgi:hypothetical protein